MGAIAYLFGRFLIMLIFMVVAVKKVKRKGRKSFFKCCVLFDYKIFIWRNRYSGSRG